MGAQKKKVLISGASGFIGRNLFETLSQRDDLEVYGVYRSRTFRDDPRLIQADLTQRKDVERVTQGFDVLIQAAANTSGAKDVIERPYIHVTDNLIMNALLYQAAYDHHIPQVIFFSCTTMYPSSDRPLKETDVDLNAEIYKAYFGVGWMKVYVEKLCEFYSRLGRSKFTVIRHSNIYGPYDKYDLERSHVFGATMTKVMTAKDKIVVWGEGKEVRDLLHVDDLVRFVILALDTQEASFDLCNVGLGQGISIAALVQKMVLFSGRNIAVEYDTSKPTIPTTVVVDTTRAREHFGWSPSIGIDEGIQKTLAWYKQHGGEGLL